MSKLYMGLDPGAEGGVVILNSDGTVLDVFKTPADWRGWDKAMEPYLDKEVFCLTEKVGAHVMNSPTSNFTFGRTVERALNALERARIAYMEIPPSKWTKGYGMIREKGESKPQWKKRLKEAAVKIFPKENVTLWNSDAFLIANFCRLNYR